MAAASSWRDKYRRALAQQENLEQTLTAYQGMLQRAVLALSSAAEGRDADLDERLQAIRSSAKHNDVAGFDRMIKSLGRVSEAAEQRQQQQWQEITRLFSAIASQLPKLASAAEIKPAVKQFKKQLPKGGLPIPATIKRQLQQISDLQALMIDASSKAESGLFSRIFKDKQAPPPHAERAKPEVIDAADAQWEEITESEVDVEGQTHLEGELDVDTASGTVAAYRERSLPEALLADTQSIE
nr:hypothetical protein [Cellvibrionaceae bacterium]